VGVKRINLAQYLSVVGHHEQRIRNFAFHKNVLHKGDFPDHMNTYELKRNQLHRITLHS
jgi:hypothetical protein